MSVFLFKFYSNYYRFTWHLLISYDLGHNNFREEELMRSILLKPFLSVAVVLAVSFLAACDRVNVDIVYGLKWAEVDEYKIKKVLEDLAKDQNKTKYAELQLNYDAARDKKNNLNDFLSKLKSEAKNDCYKLYKTETAKSKKGVASSASVIVREEAYIRSYSGDDHSSNEPLDACIDNIKNTESVKNIQIQYDQLEKVMSNKSRFEREISGLAGDLSRKIIAQYAQNKFQLLIKSDNNNIIFSAKKERLDITDAVIDYAQKNQLDMVIKNFVESAAQTETQ